MKSLQRLSFVSSEFELSGIEDSDSDCEIDKLPVKVKLVNRVDNKVANKDQRLGNERHDVEPAHADEDQENEAQRKPSTRSSGKKRVTWFDGVRSSTKHDANDITNTNDTTSRLNKDNEQKQTVTDLMLVFDVNRGDLPTGSEHFRQVLEDVTYSFVPGTYHDTTAITSDGFSDTRPGIIHNEREEVT